MEWGKSAGAVTELKCDLAVFRLVHLQVDTCMTNTRKARNGFIYLRSPTSDPGTRQTWVEIPCFRLETCFSRHDFIS